MGNEREIKLIITTDASGAVTGVRSFGDETAKAMGKVRAEADKTMSGQRSFVEKLSGGWALLAVRVAAITAPLAAAGAMIQKVAAHGEEFNKISQQIGISVERLSALKYVADQSETSLEGLTTGIKFLNRALSGTNEEGKDTTKLLKALGVTSKDPYEAMLQVADSFEKMKDGAGKSSLAMQLFGRSGLVMIPMLNEGSAGILRMMEAAKKAGVVMSGEAARASDEFGDNIKMLEARAGGLAKTIAGPLISALNSMFDFFSGGKAKEFEAGSLDAMIKQQEKIIKWKQATNEKGFGWTAFGSTESLTEAQRTLNEMYAKRTKFLQDNYSHNASGKLNSEKSDAPTVGNEDAIKLNDQLREMYAKSTLGEEAFIKHQADLWRKQGADHVLVEQVTNEELYKLRMERHKEELEAQATAYDLAYGLTEEQNTKVKELNEKFYEDDAKRKAEIIKEAAQFELEFNNQAIQDQLDARLDLYSQQESMYRDLHDHMLMSDEEYFTKMQELIAKETQVKLDALDRQFTNLVTATAEEINLLEINSAERSALVDRLTLAAQAHAAASDKVIRDSTNEQINLARQLGKTFAEVYQEMTSGLNEFLGIFGAQLPAVFGQFGSILNQAGNANSFINRMGLGEYAPLMLPAGAAMSGKWGGAAGGVGGYLLASTFQAEITSGITDVIGTAFGDGVSDAIGGALFDAIPYIGPLLGMVLGEALSGLGRGDDNLGIHINPTGRGAAYYAGDPLGSTQTGAGWTHHNAGGGYYGVTDNMGQAGWALDALRVIKTAGDSIKGVFSDLGLGTGGFDKEFIRTREWTAGEATPEAMQAQLETWFGEWITEASNIDFTPFQKNGEKFIDTVTGVINAMAAMEDVLGLIDTYIAEVKGNYDGVAAFGDSMIRAGENIDRIDKALKNATDPRDVEEYSLAETRAIRERYQAQKQMIDGLTAAIKQLDGTIEQLKANIRATERAKFDWSLGLQQKIDQLTAGSGSRQMLYSYAGKGGPLEAQYGAASSPDEKLAILNQAAGIVDQTLAQEIADIQAGARSWTETIRGNREIVQKQVDAVQAQLDAIAQWRSLLDSVRGTILTLKTSAANPDDIYARLGIQAGEVSRLKGLFGSTTGADQVKYGGQYQEALQRYLQLGQEAYQRPSREYQALYASVMAQLGDIEGVAAMQSDAQQQTTLQNRIASLTASIRDDVTITRDNSAQINEQIREANERAAAYYANIQSMGVEQYNQKMELDRQAITDAEIARATLNAQMTTITGGMDPAGWLAQKQQEAVDAMNGVKTWAETYWENFQTHIQQLPAPVVNVEVTASGQDGQMVLQPFMGAEGTVFTRPTIFPRGAVFGEAGTEVLAPRGEIKAALKEAMVESGNGQPVMLAPVFTVTVKNVSSDYDAQRLGREAWRAFEAEARQSMLTGDFGKTTEVRINNGKVKH